MLELFIEDTAIPITDDFKLSLTFVNPLFSEKKINEVWSYSFNLPATYIINNLLKHANRVDASQRKFKLNTKVKFQGVVMVQGTVELVKLSNNYYSCQLYNDGRDLYNALQSSHVADFDYGTLELWTQQEESSLSMTDKLQRWTSHVGKINDEPADKGAYKFPVIKGWYETPDKEELDVKNGGMNYIFWMGGTINYAQFNAYQPQNAGSGVPENPIPLSLFQNGKNWAQTYSPCLRIEYMLDQIINQSDLTINQNQLKEISEFKKMVQFSSYVADEWETNNINGLNVHGRKYELSDFTPDTNAWELFQLLIDTFSAVYFIKDDGYLDILLSKDLLNQEAIDMTNKSNPDYSIDKGIAFEEFSMHYDIDAADLKILNDELELAFHSQGNAEHYLYRGVGEKTDSTQLINAIPLRTSILQPLHTVGNKRLFRFYLSYEDYDIDCSSFLTYTYMSFAYFKPKGNVMMNDEFLSNKTQLMLSSREFPTENDRPDKFHILLYHGRYVAKQKIATVDPITGACSANPSDPWLDIGLYLTLNLEQTLPYRASPSDVNYPLITVSDKTIYLNDKNGESKGTFNNYHKDLSLFQTGEIEEISKILYLDPHEVNELSKFRKSRHKIAGKEGNFEGYIKEFKLTISKDKISPTNVTYFKSIFD